MELEPFECFSPEPLDELRAEPLPLDVPVLCSVVAPLSDVLRLVWLWLLEPVRRLPSLSESLLDEELSSPSLSSRTFGVTTSR